MTALTRTGRPKFRVVNLGYALTRSVRMLASAGQGMSVVRLYARCDGGDVPEVVGPRLCTQSASCLRVDSRGTDRRCR